ncbi:hypothetical protein BCR39DRAFT_504056 [Naematelia encephala]|uniref:Uncharacterized protein n=1 Tax=Naematelia encephala TaxID=71784 RepID=A0A1Y2BG74_9TREE|nr:hypothetical protein BCR39DRAFT_504056 [Naematelia encephala]
MTSSTKDTDLAPAQESTIFSELTTPVDHWNSSENDSSDSNDDDDNRRRRGSLGGVSKRRSRPTSPVQSTERMMGRDNPATKLLLLLSRYGGAETAVQESEGEGENTSMMQQESQTNQTQQNILVSTLGERVRTWVKSGDHSGARRIFPLLGLVGIKEEEVQDMKASVGYVSDDEHHDDFLGFDDLNVKSD